MYRTVVRALSDSGAVPKVMYIYLCTQLHVRKSSTNKTVRIADGTEAENVGKVTIVPVTVGDLTCKLRFFIVYREPFSLKIGRLALRDIKTSMNFGEDIPIFRKDGRTVTMPLCTDKELNSDNRNEELTSSDKKYAENETDIESSSEQSCVDECGLIGEQHIICF